MNWPPLTRECSEAVEEALREAVKRKPPDLLEHVARMLSERSGLDPVAFEAHFEECRRRVSNYVLEERCPPGQDPLAWVPMRYNDDTILATLNRNGADIAGFILGEEFLDDSSATSDAVAAAYPEVQYLHFGADGDSRREELPALLAMRAVSLLFSGCQESTVIGGLRGAEPQLCFACEALCTSLRSVTAIDATKRHGVAALDALIVCLLLRTVANSPGFANKFGGGFQDSKVALLHAIEHEPEVLPSYRRLSESSKRLVVAMLQAHFPLEMVLSCEVVPAHFAKVKAEFENLEGQVVTFVALLLVEHLVQRRNDIVSDEEVEFVRFDSNVLCALDKASVTKAYDLMLFKRAEKRSWRIGKDEMSRAVVRLCCFSMREEVSVWGQIQSDLHSLNEGEVEVMRVELGVKDGILECPVFVPVDVSKLLRRAGTHVGVIRLIASVLAEASRIYDRSLSHKMINVNFGELAWSVAQGEPFEGVGIELLESTPGEVIVRLKR